MLQCYLSRRHPPSQIRRANGTLVYGPGCLGRCKADEARNEDNGDAPTQYNERFALILAKLLATPALHRIAPHLPSAVEFALETFPGA